MIFFQPDNYQQKFIKLSLVKEVISEVEFEECSFIDCNFVDTTFERCSFLNCTFSSSVISAVRFTNSKVVEVRFIDSKVMGIDWTKLERVEEISFERCQLNYSNFRLLKLPKMKILESEAKEVDFSETNLKEADFQGTDLERSIFLKTILTKVNFCGAINYYIDPRLNTVSKASFSLPEALHLLDSFGVKIE